MATNLKVKDSELSYFRIATQQGNHLSKIEPPPLTYPEIGIFTLAHAFLILTIYNLYRNINL